MLREYLDATGQTPALPEEERLGQRPPVVSFSLVAGGRRPAAGGPVSGLMATIERLEQIVDRETSELKRNKPIDLRDFNHRKSQGLLELTRAMRGLGATAPDQGAQAALARLRAKLDANLAILRLHLAAAQEVATLIARVIRDADSDGTYSAKG